MPAAIVLLTTRSVPADVGWDVLMSLYIRAVSRSSKRLEPEGALNMYVYIYEIPEKFLKQIITSIVSRYGTVVKCMRNFLMQQRGSESVYLFVF